MQRHQLSVNDTENLITPIGINQFEEAVYEYLDRIAANSQEHNIRVPEDLYVSGFDDNHEFNNRITLTSVHVNTEHIGTHLANRIVYRLMHPEDDYEYTYIRSRTIYRESTND